MFTYSVRGTFKEMLSVRNMENYKKQNEFRGKKLEKNGKSNRMK